MNKKKMYNLSLIMQEKGVTQQNLSSEIGVSQETISAYLNGKAKPSVNTLVKIADFFNTSTDYLLERTKHSLPIDTYISEEGNPTDLEAIVKLKKLNQNDKLRALGYLDCLLGKSK